MYSSFLSSFLRPLTGVLCITTGRYRHPVTYRHSTYTSTVQLLISNMFKTVTNQVTDETAVYQNLISLKRVLSIIYIYSLDRARSTFFGSISSRSVIHIYGLILPGGYSEGDNEKFLVSFYRQKIKIYIVMQIKNISGKYLPGDKSTSISVFTNIKIIRSYIG